MSEGTCTHRQLLRAAGLRVTRARLALLDLLDKQGAPFSASQLAARLSSTCDRPTVYRNLAALTDAGLVEELGRVEGQTWYRGAQDDEPGALFLCGDCGRAYPLDARVEAAAPRWSAALQSARALLSGVCAPCLETAEATP